MMIDCPSCATVLSSDADRRSARAAPSICPRCAAQWYRAKCRAARRRAGPSRWKPWRNAAIAPKRGHRARPSLRTSAGPPTRAASRRLRYAALAAGLVNDDGGRRAAPASSHGTLPRHSPTAAALFARLGLPPAPGAGLALRGLAGTRPSDDGGDHARGAHGEIANLAWRRAPGRTRTSPSASSDASGT